MSEKPTYEELVQRIRQLEQDVFKLTESNSKLQDSEKRLMEAQQLVHLGNWSWDVNSGKVEWSKEVFNIFQLDPEKFTPQIDSILDLSPWPEDHKRDKELIQKAIESREIGFYEQRFLRPNGSTGYYFSSFKGVYDDKGNLIEIKGTVQDITERKRAENEIKRSQELLSEMTNQVPGVLYQFYSRPDGKMGLYYVSDRSEEIFGLKSDLDGFFERFTELILPEYKKDFLSSIQKVTKDVVPWHFEGILQKPTGEHVWFSGHSTPCVRNTEIVFNGILLDITEQKQTEKALRENEAVMRYIIRHDPNAIAVYDRNLHYIAVSQRYLEDYNVADKDILGKHHYEVFPEMPQRWKDVHQRVIGGAIEKNDDDYFERSDGSVTHNRWECRPWYKADGSIGGMITYTEVTTERKLAEMALKESEEKYRLAMEASNDGLWDWNIETGTVFYSKAWSSLLSEDIVKPEYQTWESKIHPEDKSDVLSSLQKHLDGETEYFQKEHRLKTKDGKWKSVLGRGKVVNRTPDGLPLRMVGTMTDITERLEIERQLRHSQKMESIGTLAGGIAHEFNNILSIIIGNNELIMEDLPGWSLSRESCEEIRLAGIRARDIVKHLLTFSRQDGSTKKPIDIASVTSEALKLIRATTPSNIEIRDRVAPDCLPIFGDSTQIHQILINLFNNAVDALPISGGRIDVELYNLEMGKNDIPSDSVFTPGKYLRLQVRDNGSGMDTETLERIFEPYFTTKDVGKGSGIGLSVVHGIVENHGGAITCESLKDKGTTFSILIPAHEGPIEEKTSKRDVLPGNGERILYVDDELPIAKLGRRHLESLGYDAYSTTDPEEALRMIKADPDRFSLVISDMAMPNMPGDKLITEILSINPEIPTIICTGYSSRMSEAKASEVGIKGFVMKPLNKNELAKKVRKVLDNSKLS